MPDGVDTGRPNVARAYDWLLGGTTNWPADREFGELVLELVPHWRDLARGNREFLRRAVRYCAGHGARQFLDIGSGIPTAGNVHQVADELDPASRVVYADHEPVTVTHAKALLARYGDPNRHAVIHADLVRPEQLWRSALGTGVLDPVEPITLLAVEVLPYVEPGHGGEEAMEYYKARLPSGSYFVATHTTDDGVPADLGARLRETTAWPRRLVTPAFLRSREEFAAFFAGWDLVEPGVVFVPEWHLEGDPDSETSQRFADHPADTCTLGAVGRKP